MRQWRQLPDEQLFVRVFVSGGVDWNKLRTKERTERRKLSALTLLLIFLGIMAVVAGLAAICAACCSSGGEKNATETLDYEEEDKDEEEEEEYSVWDDVCRSFTSFVYGEENVSDAVKVPESDQ